MVAVVVWVGVVEDLEVRWHQDATHPPNIRIVVKVDHGTADQLRPPPRAPCTAG